jgi:glutathione S-transferase
MVPRLATLRERLTELGRDYLTRQVSVAKEQRIALRDRTGSETIPTLVLEDGSVEIGEEAIRHYLEEQIQEPPDAEAHRLKAAKAPRRYLEEECECLQPATR